jgi:hypothetical protein
VAKGAWGGGNGYQFIQLRVLRVFIKLAGKNFLLPGKLTVVGDLFFCFAFSGIE